MTSYFTGSEIHRAPGTKVGGQTGPVRKARFSQSSLILAVFTSVDQRLFAAEIKAENSSGGPPPTSLPEPVIFYHLTMSTLASPMSEYFPMFDERPQAWPFVIRVRTDDNRTVPPTPSDPQPTPHWLYLLECEGGVYYAGIALDVEQRFFQHLFGLGAKFTRARPPVRVLASRAYPNKGDALRAEFRLKALPRAEKLAFFEDMARAGLAPARERCRG